MTRPNASGDDRPDRPDANALGEAGAAGSEAEPLVGWLPRSAEDLFGAGAQATYAYDLLTVDVPADRWIAALETARDTLGCTYFDWLSAVDEPGEGFRVSAHLVGLGGTGGEAGGGAAVRRLLVRTTVSHELPALPTAVGVYAGAAWHERETHEMFGVEFIDHPNLVPLLLPENFEGHPLRKDFVLAARVAKAWPGAKEPGEGAGHGAPKRRQMLPPGVPDPNEWGPLKGQVPAGQPRPARGAGRAAGAAERPPRRARSASAGSASQRATGAEGAERTGGEQAGAEQAQTAEGAARPGRAEDAGRRARPARRTASSDAPWHAAAGREGADKQDADQAQDAGKQDAAAPERADGDAAGRRDVTDRDPADRRDPAGRDTERPRDTDGPRDGGENTTPEEGETQ